MELERVEKPLREFRKLLKRLPTNPAPGEVHELRTRARKIEALAAAMEPADARQTRRLLKAIKAVRKAAGSVRDMDVLKGDLLHLPVKGTRDSVLRLVEHLSTERRKSAADLVDTVGRQRKPARQELRSYAKFVDAVARSKKPVARAHKSEGEDDSRTSELMYELAHWPQLNVHNIHPFRLKVKELRYVLELFPQADRGFVGSLGKVKDEIGDWHDWQQLGEIAREVLDAQEDQELLAQIDVIAKQKLMQALEGANALRQRYLHVQRRAS